VISFRDFMSMGRPHWRGQTSLLKAAFFFLLGSPDTHTRLRNSYVLNRIEQLGLPPQSRVLEGGCGRGVSLFWLARHHPDWQLTGVELDPVLVRSARRAVERGHRANITITEGDILELDKENTYDLIICIDVLEHIQDDVGLLRRYWRALKPGGYLVLHVPRRRQEMWRWLPMFHRHGVKGHVRDACAAGKHRRVVIEGHVREEYTAEELRQVAEKAGFRVVGLRETIGRWGEVSFELNNLLWPWPALRYLLALLTYPVAIPIGYIDVRRNPAKGNSLLLTATRD
jgi:ubiquinone/menaquinone biosynthesis C-methylase UbiE